MFFRKQIILLVISFVTILGWMAAKGQARSPLTPQDLVHELSQQFNSLKDYQCDFINTKYKNGRAIPESNKYYFKKPHLIRLEVASGKDKGSVCVYNSQGKVRAHAGGILGIFT